MLGVLSVVYLILTIILKIGLISSVYRGTDQGFQGINSLPKVKTVYQIALMLKNSPADAGGIREACLIPGSGRSPEEENGNPLHYSCLENPKDWSAWQAAVHGVAESWTWACSKQEGQDSSPVCSPQSPCERRCRQYTKAINWYLFLFLKKLLILKFLWKVNP